GFTAFGQACFGDRIYRRNRFCGCFGARPRRGLGGAQRPHPGEGRGGRGTCPGGSGRQRRRGLRGCGGSRGGRGGRGDAAPGSGGRRAGQQPRDLRAEGVRGDHGRGLVPVLRDERDERGQARASLPARDDGAGLGQDRLRLQRVGGADTGGDDPLRHDEDGAARHSPGPCRDYPRYRGDRQLRPARPDRLRGRHDLCGADGRGAGDERGRDGAGVLPVGPSVVPARPLYRAGGGRRAHSLRREPVVLRHERGLPARRRRCRPLDRV
ncbi:MAG: 3-oxoacyl-[acyl-carrier protein] reductase, partial [uncultured Rubrobacteraceae bacterium]